MSLKKFTRHIPIIALCCICLFILSCTNKEDEFKTAMESYNNKDFPKALQTFQTLAQKDYDKAEFMLGKMYSNGEGIPQDYGQAVKWYKASAEKGNAWAQFYLGLMYNYGKGVPKDSTQAFTWYTKAAQQENAVAQFVLGTMYHIGEGVPQDYKQGLNWFTKAAEQGNAKAQNTLGVMYYKGKGVPQDYKQSLNWFTKAAEQGNADAQCALGLMYSNGEGVPQDYKQAMNWYTKAAEQGNAEAQNTLGVMYYDGEGAPQDYKQSLNWFTKAAEQGNADAQLVLGVRYSVGVGAPQKYMYSYAWSSLAASQGSEDAIKFRDIIAKKMSPQQLAEAQKLAAELQNKIDNRDTSSNQQSTPTGPSVNLEPQIKGSGTGFIITQDGYLLTCYHALDGAKSIKIGVDREIYPAELIRVDKNNDLALLKITGTFTALAFSPKRTASLGDEVFTIGFPNPDLQGTNPKLTKGSINSLTGVMDDIRLYQISIPVQPGNSGGPLLDESGNICGVIVAMLDAETTFKISGSLPQNVNYAVKSTYAQALLDTLPEVAEKLAQPASKMAFDDMVKRVQKSIVMVLAY
jgi:uncharacterized protein